MPTLSTVLLSDVMLQCQWQHSGLKPGLYRVSLLFLQNKRDNSTYPNYNNYQRTYGRIPL